jgi:hypothetical protein
MLPRENYLEGQVGFAPTTTALQGECSTLELLAQSLGIVLVSVIGLVDGSCTHLIFVHSEAPH